MGSDLNDLLKAGGIQAVRRLLDEAPAFDSKFPRVMSARDFIAAERPRLEYLIEGLLPRGGKLAFSAPAKFGKSFWAIQTGFALAAGDCEFLGMKFGPPVRVHYLQAELTDQLVEARLKRLLETMPPGINRDRAERNFFVQEIVKGPPNLMDAKEREEAALLIGRYKPDVLILDPLYMLLPGLEENLAESMGAGLRIIGDLGTRLGCAVILIHHHGKDGRGSRGSSVFEAWPDSDLQATWTDPKTKQTAEVVGRLRCAYGGGPWNWRMFDQDRLWLEAMPEDWQPEGKPGRKPSVPPGLIPRILKGASAPIQCKDLIEIIVGDCVCSKQTAERALKEARDSKRVIAIRGMYSLPEGDK